MSVIIAAYNAEEFLQMAVASAREQATPELTVEIIVIDDASSDATAAVAADLAAREEDLRLVRLTTNGGPSAARNAGLEVARGEWVAVLDSDDAFEPGHLAQLLSMAEQAKADIVLANIWFYDRPTGRRSQSGLSLPKRQRKWTAADYVQRAQPLTGQVDWGLLKPMFRRAFMDARRIRYPLFSRHGEDFLLMVDALRRGARLAISPEPTYRYTTRSSGWSRTMIDYGGQVDQAGMLLDDPAVRGDLALVSALRSRISALRRWELRLAIEDRWRRGDYAGLLGAARSSRLVPAEIVRMAAGKALRILQRVLR